MPPPQSDGPRLPAESSIENAGDGHPVGASAAALGGLWSGGGLADWESRDILTLVVVMLGIALIATAHTGENPNPWPGLAGMAVIVVAQYARLFRSSSDQSGRLVAAGMVVLLFGRPRTSTEVPLTVYCVQLVLLLASAQAVFLAGRWARQQRRR